MWKKCYPVIIVAAVVSIACFLMFPLTPDACAQGGPLTPFQKTVLDRWYFQTNSAIDGSLIIDGTISTGKLDFAVVPYEDYTNFYALYLIHTNDASAHHTRFPNSEETDQVFTNWLATTGTIYSAITTVTSDYTATASDSTILINAGSQNVTVTLPTAAGISGRIYDIKSINSSNNVYVAGNGGELIDGSTNFYLYTDESITITSDNIEWRIL